jgi:hypothetical protein
VRCSRRPAQAAFGREAATTGRSIRAPSRGLAEQLNDRFPATSLGLSSAGPGHKRVLQDGRFGATQLMCWAKLLKRVFEIDMEHCSNSGGELKIIAVILE